MRLRLTRGGIDKIAGDIVRKKQAAVEKAIPRAPNRVGTMSITQASRELRAEGYNFKASEIKDSMYQRKASASNLVIIITVRRKTRSLMEFSPRESKAGVTVRIHGQTKLIKGAFIAQRLNGATGMFIGDKKAGQIILRRQKQYKRGSRGGWHSFPARKLYGPSVGGVYANDKVQDVMRRFTAQQMAKPPNDEIILARQGRASDPKRDAAVQLARKVIENRSQVGEADLNAVRDVGYIGSIHFARGWWSAVMVQVPPRRPL